MNPPSKSAPLFPIVAFLFFASGATALVYEVAWLRSLVLIFGSTAFAVSTVLSSFMAGLALGSYTIGRWVDRRGRPLVVYGLLEIGIGLFALAIPYLFQAMPLLYRGAWATLQPPAYAFALLRFALCFVVLLVPTALMGGTLPALARFTAAARRNLVVGVGGLYGVNTLGAYFGTLLAGFGLLPGFGLGTTLRVAAAVNLLIGAGALLVAWARRREGEAQAGLALEEVLSDEAAAVAPGDGALSGGIIAGAFALTGCAALALEVAWTRILALVIGPSVYAFSLMLAAFLVGLGLGSVIVAWAMARFRWKGWAPFVTLSAAAGALAFLTLLGFQRLPHLYFQLFNRWGAGNDPGMTFAIGMLLSGLVMLPPTLAMGGLFPAALEGFGVSREQAGRGVGLLYAANGGGAIAGSFAAGFIFIPALGLQRTVLLAAWLYLAVAGGLAGVALRRRPRAWLGPALALGLGFLMYVAAPPWNRFLMSSGVYHYDIESDEPLSAAEFSARSTEGYEELFYREGLVSTVMVARERDVYGWLGADSVPGVFLVTNGKVDASSLFDMPTQILSAHIPLLLHPDPRNVLVIGLASGTTAGSALRHDIESLDVVEIEPAIEQASHAFDFVNGRPLDDPRTHLTIADGRTFLLLGQERYDVIISEPSNPWMTGVSNLFTRDFFLIARRRLAAGGIFTQWVQMYGMSPQNLAVLLRTFRSVFPYVYVFNTIPYTDLILVGSSEPLAIDPDRVDRRVQAPGVLEDLGRLGIESAAGVLAHGRLGPAELGALVDRAPRPGLLNTDDNAWIEFWAPLDLYRQTREANEAQIAAYARGLAPYLTAADPEALAEFRARLAAEYERLGFRAEEAAAR